MGLIDRLRGESAITPADIAAFQRRAFQQAPQVVSTTLRGETVVFDIERGKYQSLNEVATSVWLLLATLRPFDAILDALQEEYELASREQVDQMKNDVATLLRRLEREHAIVSIPNPAAPCP